ncbi:hypothetical protein AWENTII_009667 [Aspergillus wentii]
MAASQDSLAYHEPDITTILIQSCFLLALNLINYVLDKLIYCGLIGQLLIGMAWGVPGANWLQLEVQESIQQLGYLGLLLLVYEGGLSTSFSQLKSNMGLSAIVASTGIAVPMGLSFSMLRLVDATPFQAFAAGAALCSTSIGTTFTILSTTGLAKTRLGVVLGSAAMMDDVAGLVMVQIISNIGSGESGPGSSFDATIVIRPILVAFGFAFGLGLFCRFIVTMAMRKIQASTTRPPPSIKSTQFAFVAHICILIGLVSGAQYAGTSGLFAAYLAGASISWFDETLATLCSSPRTETLTNDETANEMQRSSATDAGRSQSRQNDAEPQRSTPHQPAPTGEQVFERYCKEPLKRVLSPLFFVSFITHAILAPRRIADSADVGFHRIFNPNHQNVSWRGHLAGNGLHPHHDSRQDDHGNLPDSSFTCPSVDLYKIQA